MSEQGFQEPERGLRTGLGEKTLRYRNNRKYSGYKEASDDPT